MAKSKPKTDRKSWYERLLPGLYATLGDIVIGRVMVEPDAAAEILAKRNSHNRPMGTRQLHFIEAELSTGNFILTGETCIFNSKGILLDGQHRLQACVNTGVAFECLGQGARRSLAHTLAIRGEVSANQLAAALSFVHTFLYCGQLHHGRHSAGQTFTNHDRLALLERHPDLRRHVAWIRNHPSYERTRLYSGESLCAATHYLFGLVSPDLADLFWNALLDNQFPAESRFEVLRKLFNKCVDNQSQRQEKLTQQAITVFIIKAWNAFITATPLSNFRYGKKDSYPEVHGWTYANGLPLSTARFAGEPHVEAEEPVKEAS